MPATWDSVSRGVRNGMGALREAALVLPYVSRREIVCLLEKGTSHGSFAASENFDKWFVDLATPIRSEPYAAESVRLGASPESTLLSLRSRL
jgi:hypothetical protein